MSPVAGFGVVSPRVGATSFGALPFGRVALGRGGPEPAADGGPGARDRVALVLEGDQGGSLGRVGRCEGICYVAVPSNGCVLAPRGGVSPRAEASRFQAPRARSDQAFSR